MRIAVFAMGTRGDVQPYVALGTGLKKAGHDVRLVTHPNFQSLVREHGLEFWPVRGDVQEIAESKEMRELIERGNFIAITRQTAKEAQKAALLWAEDGLLACQNVDLIVVGIGGLFVALALSEKLNIPMVQAYLVPFSPTADFPSVLLPQSLSRLGGRFNHFSHHLTRQIIWQGSRSADNLVREKVLQLPIAPFWGPFKSDRLRQNPVLFGFSPSVIPPPSDWGSRLHVTGYWFLDSPFNWTPPTALTDFLQNGPPPVYIGFGSMSSRKPEETTELILGALARSGQRAVLLSGWGGLQKDRLPDSIFMLDSIPHDWLFPRVAAAIHHGGAGTTAAALRAGIPSVITPFFGDQPFWGQRLADLGVATQSVPRKQVTIDRLSDAIRQAVSDATMRQRAADLGAKIRAENGVAQAVEIIQSLGK